MGAFRNHVSTQTPVLHARAKLGTNRQCNVTVMAEFRRCTVVIPARSLIA